MSFKVGDFITNNNGVTYLITKESSPGICDLKCIGLKKEDCVFDIDMTFFEYKDCWVTENNFHLANKEEIANFIAHKMKQ